MASEKFCNVNTHLLPIKSHYFFFYGAVAGVIPYLPVLAKDLGINATAVGFVYTVLPFCIFFSKPLFGYLTDYFRNIKLIVFILAVVTAVAYFSVMFIPNLEDTEWTEVQLECADDQSWLFVVPQSYDRPCLKDALQTPTNCELSYRLCDNNVSVTLHGRTYIDDSGNSSFYRGLHAFNSSIVLKFEPDTNFTCDCFSNGSSYMMCSKPAVNSCFVANYQTVFKTFQFWIFTLLMVVAGTGSATVFCLSDAACYELLGDRPEAYGRQRVFATISWGCASLLAGFLNDVATGSSDIRDYSPGFYLMLALIIVDIILLIKIPLTKANFSISICKDIRKIFSSCEIVAFSVAVYIIGGLTGLVWNYLFWYLQDMGAAQTLMGLTVAVQCLAAEVPFFFFAGWFIKTFGYFYCITGSFAAFSMRFGLYYILQNPWLVLPIELLHGLSYAVFYASMTGYASDNAPPGTEATMMGILGGLFEGLGLATGSLLGGLGFDRLGGRNTFLVACIISFMCAVMFALSYITIQKLSQKHQDRTFDEQQTNSSKVS